MRAARAAPVAPVVHALGAFVGLAFGVRAERGAAAAARGLVGRRSVRGRRVAAHCGRRRVVPVRRGGVAVVVRIRLAVPRSRRARARPPRRVPVRPRPSGALVAALAERVGFLRLRGRGALERVALEAVLSVPAELRRPRPVVSRLPVLGVRRRVVRMVRVRRRRRRMSAVAAGGVRRRVVVVVVVRAVVGIVVRRPLLLLSVLRIPVGRRRWGRRQGRRLGVPSSPAVLPLELRLRPRPGARVGRRRRLIVALVPREAREGDVDARLGRSEAVISRHDRALVVAADGRRGAGLEPGLPLGRRGRRRGGGLGGGHDLLLPERLRGLLARLLVAHVVPALGVLVLLEEPARRVERAPLVDDLHGHEGLVEALGGHVPGLAPLDHLPVPLVAGVVVRPAAPPEEAVVLARLQDALQRPRRPPLRAPGQLGGRRRGGRPRARLLPPDADDHRRLDPPRDRLRRDGDRLRRVPPRSRCRLRAPRRALAGHGLRHPRVPAVPALGFGVAILALAAAAVAVGPRGPAPRHAPARVGIRFDPLRGIVPVAIEPVPFLRGTALAAHEPRGRSQEGARDSLIVLLLEFGVVVVSISRRRRV
mmetsp:Transcript_7027/g.16234  ORF Transcript_7027/g.16234 Transcript_7027/m.16234 type:complete len:592 (-) Transcript_7027:198-1973(-)